MSPELIVAIAAVLVAALASVPGFIALWRQRAAKPSWKVAWSHQPGQAPGQEWWKCEVRQLGPGEAERVVVASRIRMPGEVWQLWDPNRGPLIDAMPTPRPIMHPEMFEEWDHGRTMERGKYTWHEGRVPTSAASYEVEVEVEVQVRWVQKPDTTVTREKVFTHQFRPHPQR